MKTDTHVEQMGEIAVKRIILVIAIVAAMLAVGVATTAAQGDNYCNYPPPRLVAGGQARVTPGLPNVIRSQPWRGAGSSILGQIPAGGVFTVLAGYGPQCSEGMNWYYVSYNGLVGWTAEGNNGVYWTEPVAASCSSLAPRLTIGGQGRITPGLPNVVRNQPWRGAGSSIIGLIPAGGVFTVQGGPSCASGVQWWLVNYNGVTGWTGEGEGTTYWTEPISGGFPDTCTGALPPRLTVGTAAFVPPGFGTPLYPQAGTQTAPTLTMPGGSWIRVLSAPLCSQGVNWWQVRFNNYEGWVPETTGGHYNVDPYICQGFEPSRLMVGTSARVLPGLPNNLRAQPSLTAPILGRIPAGGTMAVVGGPQCGNNGTWWQVAVNGVYGWTMEGSGGTYWLEPLY